MMGNIINGIRNALATCGVVNLFNVKALDAVLDRADEDMEKLKKSCFEAGYKYHRNVIAESKHPFDENSQISSDKGYNEFITNQS